MTPENLKRVIELTAELEQLLEVSTTFLFGDNNVDIRGVVLADMETTDAILGQSASEDMN